MLLERIIKTRRGIGFNSFLNISFAVLKMIIYSIIAPLIFGPYLLHCVPITEPYIY